MTRLYKNKLHKYENKIKQLLSKNNNLKGGAEIVCDNNKYLCDKDTKNIGLCVDNITDCNDNYDGYIETKFSMPEIIWSYDDTKEIEAYERAKQRGYNEENLNTSCYIQTKTPREYNYDSVHESIIPDIFSIITLNVMGIYRPHKQSESVYEIMKLRVDLLTKYIIKYHPDILCFQEMSVYFFELLYPKIKHIYPYVSEENFVDQLKSNNELDINTIVISKYKPIKVIVYELKGNLNYPDTLIIVEFTNLIVFNCYCQAGSKSSGLTYLWMHFSRCRRQQYAYIKKLIKEYENKPVIVLGDFNADLNSINDFPEIEELISYNEQEDKTKLYDSWVETNPHIDKIYGATENTDINTLRYNAKFQIKMYRYDAILYTNNLKPIQSYIICDEPEIINNNDNNRHYENSFLNPQSLIDSRLKIICKDETNHNIYDLFVSDHFGVFTMFCFNK